MSEVTLPPLRSSTVRRAAVSALIVAGLLTVSIPLVAAGGACPDGDAGDTKSDATTIAKPYDGLRWCAYALNGAGDVDWYTFEHTGPCWRVGLDGYCNTAPTLDVGTCSYDWQSKVRLTVRFERHDGKVKTWSDDAGGCSALDVDLTTLDSTVGGRFYFKIVRTNGSGWQEAQLNYRLTE